MVFISFSEKNDIIKLSHEEEINKYVGKNAGKKHNKCVASIP